jgi:hypothetical protein
MILGFHIAQNQTLFNKYVEKTIKVIKGSNIVNLSIIVNSTWHINSNKPNDEFLIPSEITAKGSGVKLSNVKYPQAKNLKLSFSESPVSVYEATSNAKLTFITNANAPVGKQKVIVTLDYQACNDVSCLPPNVTTTEFELEVVEKKIDSESQSEIITPVDTTVKDINSVQSTNQEPKVEDVKTEVSKDESNDDVRLHLR